MQFYGSMKVIIIVYYTVLLEDTFGLLNLDHLVLSSRPPRQRLHVDLLACLCCWGLLFVASKELTIPTFWSQVFLRDLWSTTISSKIIGSRSLTQGGLPLEIISLQYSSISFSLWYNGDLVISKLFVGNIECLKMKLLLFNVWKRLKKHPSPPRPLPLKGP